MMRFTVPLSLLGLALLCAVSASAQTPTSPNANNFVVSLDRVTGLFAPDTIRVGQNVRWMFRYKSDSFNLGVSNGFRVYSTDGATWDSTRIDTVGWRAGDPTPGVAILGKANFDLTMNLTSFSADGHDADTVGLLGAQIALTGMSAPFNDTSFAVTAYKVSTSSHGKHICIDSAFYRPGGTWKWAGLGGLKRTPEWSGPHCYVVHDPNYVPPPNIVVTPDTLRFSATIGGGNPTPQFFQISASGAPLNFTLTEFAPWLIKSPASGSTPRQITASIDITGLTAGVYFDSIRIESGTAPNSPQWKFVRLSLVTPPPTISATPASFLFNAVSTGSNPTPALLTVKNAGGGSLNWSLSHTQSWLSVLPASGVDSAAITVSVDMTGLPLGSYYDTIVVFDPAATNNPVRIPVRFNIASGLPMIVVDSTFNYIIVDTGISSGLSRDLLVRNANGGPMQFDSIKVTSTRLFTVTPSSGATPQNVHVEFKTVGGTEGNNYYDTLFVYSSEASNSPYPVAFLFHYVAGPAILHLSKDTVTFKLYDCSPGYARLYPMDQFQVTNFGHDNPVVVNLVHESPFFTIDFIQGVAPKTFRLQSLFISSLSLGTYYDTIMVTALNAINSPQLVIVKYTKAPPDLAPELMIVESPITIPSQEEGGLKIAEAEVWNANGGCMPWSYAESIPWYTPLVSSGNSGGVVRGLVDPTGYTLGTYADSFYVVAPDATNNPQTVVLIMKIWRFHGDNNWDGYIDISDVLYLVDYLSGVGPGPQPEYAVGDVGCDSMVDIEDVNYLGDYLFLIGPPPCGNP